MLFFHNRKEVTVRQMLFCTICLQIPEQSKQFPSIKHEHEHEDAFVNIVAEDTYIERINCVDIYLYIDFLSILNET